MRSWRGDLGFGVAACGLLMGFVYLQILRSVEPLGMDQGLFACFGRWIPDGALPYVDIWDSKPPATFYTYALAGLMPGDTVTSLWWLEAFWLLAILAVGFGLAARSWGRWAGLVAAGVLFFGLWAPGWGGYWARAQAEEFCALPLLGAAWLARSPTTTRRAFVVGALTGVAGLYKVPALAVAAAWPIGWWVADRRRSGQLTGIMVAGIATPWLVTAIWFGAHGGLGELAEAVFVYNRHYAAVISPPWSTVVVDFFLTLVTVLPAMVAAASVGVVVLVRERAATTWWLLPWLGATALAVMAQRELAGYHFLLVVPALAITATYGVVALASLARRPRPHRWLGVVGLVVVVGLLGPSLRSWQRVYGDDASYRAGKLSRKIYLRRLERGAFSPATEVAAAEYLRLRSRPDDTILVWGLSPGIYAQSGRRPATRYAFHQLLLTRSPLSRRFAGLERRQEQFLAGLRAAPPAFILIGVGDQNGFEPLDGRAEMAEFPAFRELVADRYREQTRIGRFAIYHHVDRALQGIAAGPASMIAVNPKR